MLVYGDAQEDISVQDLIRTVNARFAQCDLQNFEAVRALLIEAGQLEQAVADCDELANLAAHFEHLTNWAADLFCDLYFGKTPGQMARPAVSFAASELEVRLKVPEGFAFYALYPEQYCTSAADYANRHGKSSAVVIGLRSIGTTLSAVVNATLRVHGWKTSRITVRASGNPFAREAELPDLPSGKWAFVVDEGPGMSGSSMAAVASALRKLDYSDDRIIFMPAHENGPGDKAPPAVRQTWNSVQVVTTRLNHTKWDHRSLRQQLIESSFGLIPAGEAIPVLEDCSGGLWRKFAYRNESEWPAASAQFERLKFLYPAKSSSILWKFVGLVPSIAEQALRQMDERSELTNSPAPLKLCNGFVGTHWIDGTRLKLSDQSSHISNAIADYIANSAQPPLAPDPAIHAIDRLKQILMCNLRERFGPVTPALERFIRTTEPDLNAPRYGDGRTAPHEWVRTPNGEIFKTDCTGHDNDHTLIGKQAIYWDIAGAIVEWKMTGSSAEQFISNCTEAGLPTREEHLAFYQLAYAAFRLGFCTLNQGLTRDENEIQRLRSAAEYYGMLLSRLMRTSLSNTVTMLSEPGLISTRDMMSSEMPRK
jgi:hypothetical protein